MKIFIYILHLSNNTFYTGITNNLQRRIKQHQNGESVSTKYYLPFNICYINVYNSYLEARKHEVWIKSIGAYKFMMFLKFKQTSPPLLANYPKGTRFKKDNINITQISFPQL